MLGCSLLPAAAALLMVAQTHASSAAVQVCRQADGFQKSLVSPEFGLKRLVSEAVETVADPVTSAVYKIHLVLIDAARCA